MNFTIDTNIIIAVAGGIVSVSAAYAVVRRSIKKITNKIKDELKKEVKEEVKNELIDPIYKQAVDQYKNDLNEVMLRLEKLTTDFEKQSHELMAEHRQQTQSAYAFRISTLKGLIVQSHSTYTQLGHIEPMVLATIEDIYSTYTNIGGNHFVGDLMEELRALPRV